MALPLVDIMTPRQSHPESRKASREDDGRMHGLEAGVADRRGAQSK